MELRGQLGDHLATPLTAAVGGRERVWLAWACLLAIVSVPVASVALPPLVDAPNHLARMAILAAGGSDDVRVAWSVLPNLAEDLAVPVLGRVLGIEAAQRLFVWLAIALPALGTLLLFRAAHGQWRLWPLAGFLCIYHRSLLWGFLNYTVALGLALSAAAAWRALDERPLARAGAGIVGALACYLAHIEGFAVYAVIVLGLELPILWRAWRAGAWRRLVERLAVAASQAVLPVGLFIAHWQGAGDAAIQPPALQRKPDLLFGVFDNYSRPFDIACFALVAGLFVWLAATRRLGLDRRLGLALLLLFVLFLALPSGLLTGFGADHRLPPALALVLIAASSPRWPGVCHARAIGAALVLLLAVRIGVIERVWLASAETYRADLMLLDQVPAGARLAVAFPDRAVAVGPAPEIHLPLMATVRRQVFVPTLFAFPAQQPLALSSDARRRADAVPPALVWQALQSEDPLGAVASGLADYDYLVAIDRRPFALPDHAELEPVGGTPTVRLFRIDRAQLVP